MTTFEFDTEIEKELRGLNVPACSYAIIFPDGLLVSGAIGLADISQFRSATADTVYHLFSATKLYTATAVMQFIEAEKLSLEDPLTKILPEYQATPLNLITIQNLLNHTSGLIDTVPAIVSARRVGKALPDTMEVLRRYKLKAARPPGGKIEYRNVNYMILGEIIERISGQNYVDYVTSHILHPLGMKVGFTHPDTLKADLATGYVGRWNPTLMAVRLMMPELRWVIGGRSGKLLAMQPYELDSIPVGGLVGSVVQFAPFLRAHLNHGADILSKESALKMRELTAKGQAGFDSKVGMGLGWKIGETNGRRFFNHEGSGAGFATETRIYPDQKIGIILMTNGYGISVHRTLHKICEAICDRVQH